MEKIFTDKGDYIELNESVGDIKMITKIAGKISWNAATASSKKSKMGGFLTGDFRQKKNSNICIKFEKFASDWVFTILFGLPQLKTVALTVSGS